MAAVVDSIVSFTIEEIGELLIQQAGYSYGVHEKVESIHKDLRWMQSFLRDADRRLGEGDQRVKTLVADVWGVARRVEDAIDMFRLREERRRRTGPIKKCFYALSDFISLREIGKTIEAIKKEIGEISVRKMIFGTPEINGGEGPSYVSRKLQDYRRAAALADGDEVVGFAKDADALVERLTIGGAGGSRRRRVVSIVATGGAGKTTLANKIYKSDDVKSHFGDSVAWVCVSQNYSAKHLLQEIATKFLSMSKQDSEGLCEKELQETLSEFLREQRYLVVLDDMWDADAWEQLKAAFPDTKNGSRIILTTRNERVALHADPDPENPPYRLPHLNPDDSWKLFLKKAFPWEETSTQMPRSSSSELVDIGKQIVAKCGGLPLAISVIGGVLAAKGEAKVKDWRNVLASLKAELSGLESVHCGDIIALSYYDLPHHLKPCFLYLGLFPEDYQISTKKLKMLWIAEGFIQTMEGREQEDLAEDYLAELIGRNLIQVVERGSLWSWFEETCRIHDLLHAFAISEGKQHKFVEIYSAVSPPTSTTTEARWLAIHDDAGVSLINSTPNIRSLLWFGEHPNLVDLSKGLKLLRVLHFQPYFCRLPLRGSIGQLSHLRYLNLEAIRISVLPPSIWNFHDLETLLLPYGVRLPKEIWRLHRLKHLEAPWCQFEGQPRVDNLKNLRTLTVGSGSWIVDEKSLSSLGGLRNLEITSDNESDWMMEGIGSLIGKLVTIQSFKLSSGDSGAFGDSGDNVLMVPSLTRHLRLFELWLNVRLEKLPELPPTLTMLLLEGCALKEDPMPTLETLPNLCFLHLKIAYTGKKMISSAHGFPQLKCLAIYCLAQLEELAVEQGAMPKLEFVVIQFCKNLSKLSEGLRCINGLKKIVIGRPSMELKNWLQEANEEGWYKNQHFKTSPVQFDPW